MLSPTILLSLSLSLVLTTPLFAYAQAISTFRTFPPINTVRPPASKAAEHQARQVTTLHTFPPITTGRPLAVVRRGEDDNRIPLCEAVYGHDGFDVRGFVDRVPACCENETGDTVCWKEAEQ